MNLIPYSWRDNGNITITDGLKKVFKSNFKFDIAK